MPGLIPQAFIDDLLSRADIVDVIDKRIKLRKTGRNYSALCPFHKEKSPSFSVEPDKQFYYCFGCGAGGNAVGFVMNYENVDFPQAVEMLAGENGLEVPRETSRADAKQKSERAPLLEILERASNYFQFQLRNHSNKQLAVEYLKARGLSGEIAKRFLLGFAPEGWDNLIKALGTSADEQQLLAKAGLIIKKDSASEAAADKPAQQLDANRQYYDRFRNRIMFPIRDSRGKVVAFGGRVLGDDKPKYLNSPETPVFIKGKELYGLYEARKFGGKLERVIFVEGYMDVIALAQMGIHNAVAALGTASNATHLNRLFRLVNEVIFCFDGDDAGRNAAWRALQNTLPLMVDGRHVRFLFLPDGEDPDSLVRKIGKQVFLDMANKASSLEEFLFTKLTVGLDLNAMEDKADLGKLAKPLIQLLPKGIYARLMTDRLASLIGISSEALQELMTTKTETAAENKGPLSGLTPPNYPAPPRGSRAAPLQAHRRERLTTYRKPWSLKAIELLLHNPAIASSLEQDLSPLLTVDGENSKMLLDLIDLVRKNPTIDTYTMLGYFYGSPLGSQLTQLMRNEKITPQEGVQEEFRDIIDRILSSQQQKADVDRSMETLRARIEASNSENSPGS